MRGHQPDPWEALRQRTPARVALGRAGASLPTAEVLKFALDHAEARDAVHAAFDSDAIIDAIADMERWLVVGVESTAADTADYLVRPDRGRHLSAASIARLQSHGSEPVDVVLILADGLSATAANRHGVALLAELVPRLNQRTIGPIIIAKHARVAIQDEVGHALKARCCVIILGERPGLGTADSLGAYLIFNPGPGKSDADRNCVSNIRPAGLPLAAAADTIAYLIDASLSRRISGVALKDDRIPILAPSSGNPGERWGGGLPDRSSKAARRPPP